MGKTLGVCRKPGKYPSKGCRVKDLGFEVWVMGLQFRVSIPNPEPFQHEGYSPPGEATNPA